MFEDLFGTENNNNDNRTNEATTTQEEKVWDTGLIWDTGQLPKEVWTVN
jgi:hypothetical protein